MEKKNREFPSNKDRKLSLSSTFSTFRANREQYNGYRVLMEIKWSKIFIPTQDVL